MFPKDKGIGLQDGFSMDTLLSLIRAAINGDEHAKEIIMDFIDFYEQNKDQFDMLYDNGGFDIGGELGDNDNKYPMVLLRQNIQEYHVRIKLNDIDCKIWREVKVPSNITLQALAELLLEVTGWQLEHLYSFRFKGKSYSMKEYIEDSVSPCNDVDLASVTLSDVLTEKGVRMKLEYDYGDSWEHDVWVKGIREYDKGETPSIQFVTGHGKCPPEDCGGVWGYAELLGLTQKKKLTAKEREILECYEMDSKSDFDPEYCDIDYFKDVAEEYNNILQGKLV